MTRRALSTCRDLEDATTEDVMQEPLASVFCILDLLCAKALHHASGLGDLLTGDVQD